MKKFNNPKKYDFTMIMCSNSPPLHPIHDTAVWRRFRVIPFEPYQGRRSKKGKDKEI